MGGTDGEVRLLEKGIFMVRLAQEKDLNRGFARMELDAWEFNQGAPAFYKAVGLQTFREFLEWDLTDGQ